MVKYIEIYVPIIMTTYFIAGFVFRTTSTFLWVRPKSKEEVSLFADEMSNCCRSIDDNKIHVQS